MKIDINSWHYKAARQSFWGEEAFRGNGYILPSRRNFCSYFWAVFWGTLAVIFKVTCVGLLLGFIIGIPLAGTLVGLMTGYWTSLLASVAVLFWALIGAIGIFIGFCYSVVMFRESKTYKNIKQRLKADPMKEKKTGFFATAYRSFKEKTCILIETVDESKTKEQI